MSQSVETHLKKIETWKRIMFMLLFMLIDSLVKMLLWLVVFTQTGSVLLTGAVNANILEFGYGLATYHYRITLFLTFNSEQLPFPFTEWQLNAEPSIIEHPED